MAASSSIRIRWIKRARSSFASFCRFALHALRLFSDLHQRRSIAFQGHWRGMFILKLETGYYLDRSEQSHEILPSHKLKQSRNISWPLNVV